MEAGFQVLHVADQGGGPRQQGLAILGQRHLARGAVEHPHAQPRLQLLMASDTEGRGRPSWSAASEKLPVAATRRKAPQGVDPSIARLVSITE
jgi:hypothetical protein